MRWKTLTATSLAFDTTLADPEVTYRMVTIDDEVACTVTLKKSQLSH